VKRSTRAGRPSPWFNGPGSFQVLNDFYGHLDGASCSSVWPIFWIRIAAFGRRGPLWRRRVVILMPETDAEQSQQLAGKLRSWIASDLCCGEERHVQLRSSHIPDSRIDAQELIQVADASMYLSKHQGGNAVSTADHFNPTRRNSGNVTSSKPILASHSNACLQRAPMRSLKFTAGSSSFADLCPKQGMRLRGQTAIAH